MLLNYIYNTIICVYTAVTDYSLSLFNKMVVIDSVISATEYVASIFTTQETNINDIIENINETEKQNIINNSKYISNYIPDKYLYNFDFNYEITLTKKYFLFIACDVIFLLTNQNSIIEKILLLNAISPILDLVICSKIFNNIYNSFIDNINHTIKYILSNITAKILNDIVKIAYDTNPNIDYYEIYSYYSNINELCNNILIFAKTFFILFYYNYLKKTTSSFYKIILNTLYKYNSQELLSFYSNKLSDTEKKNLIKDIFTHRKWHLFLEPNTLNIFFDLYYKNNQQLLENKITTITNKINLNIKRFIALWSINIINCYIAVIIDFYFVFINQKYTINKNLYTYLLACIINCSGLLSFDFLGPLIIVTSDIILTFIIRHFLEKVEIENKKTLLYKISFCFLIYLAKYYSFIYLLYAFINIFVLNSLKRKKILLIYSFTIMLSSLSYFSLLNIIIINYLMHIAVFKYYYNNKKIEIVIENKNIKNINEVENENKVKKLIQSFKNNIIQQYF